MPAEAGWRMVFRSDDPAPAIAVRAPLPRAPPEDPAFREILYEHVHRFVGYLKPKTGFEPVFGRGHVFAQLFNRFLAA